MCVAASTQRQVCGASLTVHSPPRWHGLPQSCTAVCVPSITGICPGSIPVTVVTVVLCTCLWVQSCSCDEPSLTLGRACAWLLYALPVPTVLYQFPLPPAACGSSAAPCPCQHGPVFGYFPVSCEHFPVLTGQMGPLREVCVQFLAHFQMSRLPFSWCVVLFMLLVLRAAWSVLQLLSAISLSQWCLSTYTGSQFRGSSLSVFSKITASL